MIRSFGVFDPVYRVSDQTPTLQHHIPTLRLRANSFLPYYQQGAALIVALILLLIMSILGLSSIRSTVMEEKMTTASYDRSLAFQAAEAALRAGEAIALAQSARGNASFPSSGVYTDVDNTCGNSPCGVGLCAQPDPDCPPRWLDPSFDGWTVGTTDSSLAGAPRFIVEYLGNDYPCAPENTNSPRACAHYRITARSNPGAGRADVILQSIYITNSP